MNGSAAGALKAQNQANSELKRPRRTLRWRRTDARVSGTNFAECSFC
jgi:hypothetical protein